MDDDPIRTLVMRLSRTHRSGGKVIERAAILAEGPDSAEIFAWIDAHDGEAETLAPPAANKGGLHSARPHDGSRKESTTPLRYVLPPGAFT
jgi:hypothetical protein